MVDFQSLALSSAGLIEFAVANVIPAASTSVVSAVLALCDENVYSEGVVLDESERAIVSVSVEIAEVLLGAPGKETTLLAGEAGSGISAGMTVGSSIRGEISVACCWSQGTRTGSAGISEPHLSGEGEIVGIWGWGRGAETGSDRAAASVVAKEESRW